ncbi:MAG: T9SS type A sorting domain-containing protein [Bacteroidetes bacterium]|nr:T9SS type A sorting domain-containing protein [Bacteroidota bacterium]
MKKQLLLGSALLAAISVYPQNGRIKASPSGMKDMSKIIAARFATESIEVTPTPNAKQVNPVQNPNVEPEQSSSAVSMPPSTINWKPICGSINIVGMLVSQSQPLNYNDELNAVSFIHRKSLSYTAYPAIPANAQSGVIVAEITSNWGNTWDSTVIWADATNWGRYPQGGIYNPVGNTNISNAYVVGMGPVTPPAAGWVGNWAASRQLNAFTNTLSTTPNAQQYLASNLASYAPNTGPFAFGRYGFSATDDGVVRSMGWIMDDPSALTGMRGLSVVKGSFNAGAFNWTNDSIVPAVILKQDGTRNIFTQMSNMAWNESGTVGYVMVMGAASGATGSNKGAFQPIIYKTTNSGTSWAQLPGIDFNSAAMAPLLDHISSISSNTALAIPFFNDADMVVDANNKLHIGATFKTGFSNHVDSLAFSGQFTVSINPGENYSWPHTPGQHPYLYDFIGDGTAAWTVKTIDSLSTEEAGVAAGDDGVNDNPWAATGSAGSKTDNVDSRIQLGRTPDGQYVTFSFSESDTNFTNGGRKYNSLPNVKTRLMRVAGLSPYEVSPTEINATKVAVGTGTNNPSVSSRGTLHYLSPKTGSATISTVGTTTNVDVYTPMTVTNSNPLDPILNNTTWYQTGKLSYVFLPINGVAENSQNSASSSVIYPNPASNNAVLAIDLKDNSSVDVNVMNALGQVVKTTKANAQTGSNQINIDLNGLSTGIYIVNVKVGNATSTKKLIVQ